MSEEAYAIAAAVAHRAATDKERKFFYNDMGVFEGLYNGYDQLGTDKFRQLAGPLVFMDKLNTNEFLESLYCGHHLYNGVKSFDTKGQKLFPNGLPVPETWINVDRPYYGTSKT